MFIYVYTYVRIIMYVCQFFVCDAQRLLGEVVVELDAYSVTLLSSSLADLCPDRSSCKLTPAKMESAGTHPSLAGKSLDLHFAIFALFHLRNA